MKIKNGHNHSLTKESLLTLLENKSSYAHDMEALDDFEKEALEGFNLHTTPKDAAEYMEEIDSAISNKVMQSASDSKKRGLVWFSIAASVTFIIGLSVLLLQQQSVQTEKQVALNELTKEDNKADNTQSSSPNESLKFENAEGTVAIDQAKRSTTTNSFKQAPEISSQDNDLKSAITNKRDDEVQNAKDKTAEGFTNNNQTSISKEYIKSDADKMSERAESAPVAGLALAKKSSSSNSSVISSASGADQQPTVETKQVTTDITTATSDYENVRKENVGASSTKAITLTAAHYKGGTKAIKKMIVNYEKSNPFNQPLQGDFLVKGKVRINGTFLISQIVSRDAVFIEYLTNALQSIKDWVPAKNGSSTIDSDIEFKLRF